MKQLAEFFRDCGLAVAGLVVLALCLIVAALYRIAYGEWPHIYFPIEDRD